jgi:competence protein ComEA
MKTLLSFVVAAVFALVAAPFAAAETSKASQQVQAEVQEAININTADAQTLARLKGVGLKKAEAIIAWREANGPFVSVDQLTEVKGIGEATLAANRDKIRI